MNNLLVSNNKYHITVLKLIYSHLLVKLRQARIIQIFSSF